MLPDDVLGCYMLYDNVVRCMIMYVVYLMFDYVVIVDQLIDCIDLPMKCRIYR